MASQPDRNAVAQDLQGAAFSINKNTIAQHLQAISNEMGNITNTNPAQDAVGISQSIQDLRTDINTMNDSLNTTINNVAANLNTTNSNLNTRIDATDHNNFAFHMNTRVHRPNEPLEAFHHHSTNMVIPNMEVIDILRELRTATMGTPTERMARLRRKIGLGV